MGDAFHRRLRELCAERAARYAGAVAGSAVVDAVRTSRLNLLARIENTSPGAGAGALRIMKVALPNESHLLAAIHLARGGLHLTMNFDDGIERAYALLAGTAPLPRSAPPEFEPALAAWRDQMPGPAPALRVVSRAGEIPRALRHRPLLIKLHGSLGRDVQGLTLPTPLMTDEPDPGDLGTDRQAAFDALGAEDFVLVTGFSGTDLASGSAVLDRLRTGRFRWIAPEVEAGVQRRLRAIDDTQPVAGRSHEALRELLAVAAPPWPRRRIPGDTFDDRLDRWAAGLTPEVAGEALAWALSDAGHVEQAAEILGRLVRDGAGAQTRVRLADALSRRRGPGDLRSARWILLAAACTPAAHGSGPPGRRSYSVAHLAEISAVPAGPALLTARTIEAFGRAPDHPTRCVRNATVALAAVLSKLERDLPDLLRGQASRRRAQRRATRARAVATRLVNTWAHAPSGRRGALLHRQAVELELIDALLHNAAPPPSAAHALQCLAAVFDHVSDPGGSADTAATQALMAYAAGDFGSAADAYRAAVRLNPDRGGVVALAGTLLAATTSALPACG